MASDLLRAFAMSQATFLAPPRAWISRRNAGSGNVSSVNQKKLARATILKWEMVMN